MKNRISELLTAAGAVSAGLLFLLFAPLCVQGVRQGLALCGETLIPSLFPFMALAMFVSRSRAGSPLGRLMSPLCRRWLRLPAAVGPVLLMSLIGGYPVGARMLAGMLDRGEVTPAEAQRCLQFSVSPAPSFAIVTLGAGLMGSIKAGAVLYGCHLFTGLLLGGWYALRCGAPRQTEAKPLTQPLPLASAMVESVASAVEGMLSICGFVLLFSALLSLLEGTGFTTALAQKVSMLTGGILSADAVSAAFCGLLEVTCGVFACRELPWSVICVLLPLLVSFGSVSVLCQITACLRGRGISFGALLGGRVIHGLLSALMAAPLLWQFRPALAVWAQAARPLTHPSTALSAAGLLGMCSLLVLSLGLPPIKQNRFKPDVKF